ncbi:MAG TPA: FtsX-like permease family protein [Acidimicrobiales bacterium]|nr:FtsX-like permease family protein [Acidimicrobiales bacterium]
MIVVVLAAVVVATMFGVSVKNPLVRRIALRNASRRPREGALVVMGCVLGTALIVGSSAVGSSYTGSIQQQALGELGALDATVTYETRDNWAAANAHLANTHLKGVAFAAAVATVSLPLTSGTTSYPEPAATLIEADYRRAAPLLGAAGAGPVSGTAWASQALADKLNVKVGSTVVAHIGTHTVPFVIARVTARPLAKFTATAADAGRNMLVAPGTITALQARDAARIFPRWLTLIGATGRHAVGPPSSARVNELERALGTALTTFNPRVTMLRSVRLERALAVGSAASKFLTTIGAFSILAGALLLVNVLLMLAEERMPELGAMRAIGLPRRPLTWAFTLEGAIYALIGSVLGAGAGVALGRVMVLIAQNAGNPQASRAIPNQLRLQFVVGQGEMVRGAAAGFLLSIFVAAVTSYRISRFDVIRSLRSLPAPPIRRGRATTPVLWAVIVTTSAIAAVAIARENGVAMILAPTAASTALGVLIARRFGWKAGVTAACVPNICWAVAFQTINKASEVASASVVLGGVVLVISGVLLLNAHQSTAAQALRRIGRGRISVTSRLGLSNPVAHRVRTLLTVGPLALVVFTLAYAEGLSGLITHELRGLAPTLGGDYELYANSSAPNPFDYSTIDPASVDAIAPISTLVASFSGGTTSEQRVWSMTAFDAGIADRTPPLLVSRAKRFKDDRAVYRAVAADPDLVIVPSNFLFSHGQRLGRSKGDPTRQPRVGDSYTMLDLATGRGHDVVVAGVGYLDATGLGAMYGADGARELFGARLVASGALIDARIEPGSLAKQLNNAGVANGMDAAVVEDLAHQQFDFVNNIVNLYRSDLGIGIVVGVAGIGVVLVRAVRDRRQQIGMLRAMGVDSAQIGWSFLLEGAFVATQGLVVGACLGSVMVMGLARSPQIRDVLGFNPPLPMPSPSLLALTLGVLFASLLASVLPARAASRIPPAVALRLVD